MKFRELAVPGAWEITPQVHTDSRGAFFEWFTDSAFTEFAGHRFDLRQANCSVSSAGALRGVHFAQLPPSQAKYVRMPERGQGVRRDRRHPGRVADIRKVGCGGARRTGTGGPIYLSEGLGHAFFALDDDSTVMYLCSAPLQPRAGAHHQRA